MVFLRAYISMYVFAAAFSLPVVHRPSWADTENWLNLTFSVVDLSKYSRASEGGAVTTTLAHAWPEQLYAYVSDNTDSTYKRVMLLPSYTYESKSQPGTRKASVSSSSAKRKRFACLDNVTRWKTGHCRWHKRNDNHSRNALNSQAETAWDHPRYAPSFTR